MGRRKLAFFLTLTLLVQTPPMIGRLGAATAEENSAMAADTGWPREVSAEGNSILVYQPQVEKWENNQIVARAAVSVTTPASSRPRFGVIWFTARTDVDRQKGLVDLEDLQITRASFPGAADKTEAYRAILQKDLPKTSWTIALERLQANVAITQAEMKAAPALPLKNEPPKIFVSDQPAVLVLIDGKPAMRKVEGTELMRVLNTRPLILLHKPTGTVYLRLTERWMQAKDLDGPWQAGTNIPAEVEKTKEAAVASGQIDLLTTPETMDANAIPKIFVSTVPAELIVTQGKPQFTPIDGTQLLVVNNTSSSLFLNTASQDYYFLVSGRWFRTSSYPDGRWEYVPGKKLPADFARIPETHPNGDILAAIPETAQAKEAVIENSIPETATVDRKEANLTVEYDGNADFRAIEGTPLLYAINSPMPVIRVDASTYYSVQNGVWFVATSPTGPWAVAALVPAVIYTIPPSSPLHYVTYVKVYGATPEVVYVGYTPGYFGSAVSTEHVVVYGTGWYYPPYIGAWWIGFPITYGFHVNYHWTWGWGWGWSFGYVPYTPWWGPFGWGWGPHHHHHDYHHHHHARNVTINNVNVYQRWPKSTVKKSVQRPGPALQASSPKTRGAAVRGPTRRAGENNLYAGPDGEVYRRGKQGWEKNQGERWEKVAQERGSPTTPPETSGGAIRTPASSGTARPGTKQHDPRFGTQKDPGRPTVALPNKNRSPSVPTHQKAPRTNDAPSRRSESIRVLEQEHRARDVGEARVRQHAAPAPKAPTRVPSVSRPASPRQSSPGANRR